eukprot:5674784-Amphidinium_carterae.1
MRDQGLHSTSTPKANNCYFWRLLFLVWGTAPCIVALHNTTAPKWCIPKSKSHRRLHCALAGRENGGAKTSNGHSTNDMLANS